MSQQFGASALLRSVVMMTGSTYATYAAGLLASAILARTLGPDDYGRYAYVVWLSGLLVMVMNNGMTTSSIRFISEFLGRGLPQTARALARRFAIWQAASVVLASLLFLGVLPWLQPTGWASHLGLFVVVALLASLGKAVYLFRVSVAKGYGQFSIEAVASTATALLSLAGVALLAWKGSTLNEMLFLFVAVNLAQWPILWGLLYKHGHLKKSAEPPATIDADLGRRVKSHVLWTLLLALVGALSNKSVETLLLNRWADGAVLAYFTLAVSLTRGGVDLLSSGLNSIMMSTMAHGFGSGGVKRVGEITADAMRIFHFLGCMAAGIGLMLAQPVVFLMYGKAYEPAAWAFQVLMVVGGMTMCNGALGSLLSTTDNQRVRTIVTVCSIAVSALVALALVPKWGLNGALASHAASTFVVLGITLFFIQRYLGVSVPWGDLLRCTLTAVLALVIVGAPLLAWDNPWFRLVLGAVFVPLFGVLSVRLGTWRAKDVAMLGKVAQRFPAAGPVLAWMERWAR